MSDRHYSFLLRSCELVSRLLFLWYYYIHGRVSSGPLFTLQMNNKFCSTSKQIQLDGSFNFYLPVKTCLYFSITRLNLRFLDTL